METHNVRRTTQLQVRIGLRKTPLSTTPTLPAPLHVNEPVKHTGIRTLADTPVLKTEPKGTPAAPEVPPVVTNPLGVVSGPVFTLDLASINAGWDQLSEPIRTANLTLIHAAGVRMQREVDRTEVGP